MPGGLLTDLYEITMATSYLRRGMTADATFSLFVRAMPPVRGFLVACGLESCLQFLESFSFSSDDLDHLRSAQDFDADAVDMLRGLRFTGDVWAVPEGTIVLAGEPILEVTAPIAEAQLVETVLLNLVGFQTGAATKAARCVLAANGLPVVDFAFRRTHGLDAAVWFARAAAIAGFASTSNVEAARRFGIPASGTMAHSFVEAFAGEREAFAAFAADHPRRTTFLVDTFDTLSGVAAAVDVIREHGLLPPLAIRLDSGDLLDLAVQARRMLDVSGLQSVRILASGGLDEYAIADLVEASAPIDGFGVGTKVGVSADWPALETAYKLVEYDGRAVMKLSPGKASWPGRKQVLRGARITDDRIGLRAEDVPATTVPLLVPVMRGGRRTSGAEPLEVAAGRLRSGLASLPAASLRIRHPVAPEVHITTALEELTATTTSELGAYGDADGAR